MKKLIFGLSLVLTVGLTMLSAQRQYTVQVGSFLDVRPNDFDPIRPLGFLYATQVNTNLSQVYMGGYSSATKAEQIANTLRRQGYPNAQVLEVPLDQGRNRTVVQIATRYINKPIEWEEFDKAGDLYAILDDDKVKVVVGPYASVEAAKAALPAIQRSGYSDAFIKNENSKKLIPVTSFESGVKKPLIPLTFNNQPPPVQARPQEADQVVIARPPVVNQRPPGYEATTPRILTPRSPNQPAVNSAPASTTELTAKAIPTATNTAMELPNIRAKVKRRSALDLQKVLKAKGYYSSSLDGYYGAGTTKAYQNAMQKDAELRKYQILAENYELPTVEGQANRLQKAINDLLTDRNAPFVVESSAGPVADAYKAYLIFLTQGARPEVNDLMNGAIKAAYSKAKVKEAPFDFRSTYAYQDLDQLIQHLHYIHAAPGITYSLPCWLYQQHPQETARARTGLGDTAVKMQACDPFQQWQEIRLLETIAYDMSGQTKPDAKQIATAAAARSLLYLTDKPLNREDAKTAATWHQDLWDNISAWTNRDPLHQQIGDALKIAYFQSQVRLEDYYMDQGFKAPQAKELALATLHTLVSIPLERFS